MMKILLEKISQGKNEKKSTNDDYSNFGIIQ